MQFLGWSGPLDPCNVAIGAIAFSDAAKKYECTGCAKKVTPVINYVNIMSYKL